MKTTNKQPAHVWPCRKKDAVTQQSLVAAYLRAVGMWDREGERHGVDSAEAIAGFVVPEGQTIGERKGIIVTVKVESFSEEELTKRPSSGGIIKRKK